MSTIEIGDLSFVADRRKGKRRCFWHIPKTADPEELGLRLALEYLAFEEADKGGPGNLQLIVQDMPRELAPAEIGFLTLVSYAAGAGADKARKVKAYWNSCKQAERVRS
jgi:hypothetical protein